MYKLKPASIPDAQSFHHVSDFGFGDPDHPHQYTYRPELDDQDQTLLHEFLNGGSPYDPRRADYMTSLWWSLAIIALGLTSSLLCLFLAAVSMLNEFCMHYLDRYNLSKNIYLKHQALLDAEATRMEKNSHG